ncbi:MAG: hypothetical protein AB7U63_06470, partial [Porticoccaceae bacterium]
RTPWYGEGKQQDRPHPTNHNTRDWQAERAGPYGPEAPGIKALMEAKKFTARTIPISGHHRLR